MFISYGAAQPDEQLTAPFREDEVKHAIWTMDLS